jgi:hypothetical protein
LVSSDFAANNEKAATAAIVCHILHKRNSRIFLVKPFERKMRIGENKGEERSSLDSRFFPFLIPSQKS